MKQFSWLSIIGALLLAACLIGYALYELVLYPSAGFPTTDFAVIVAGANTLRVGHWLKFGYALSLALLIVGLYSYLNNTAPTLMRLATIAGVAAIVLFLASGQLGLRILTIAEETFAANPSEAVTTILLRTVTIALFEAATTAIGWYALLTSIAIVRTHLLSGALGLMGIVLGILFIGNSFLPNNLALTAPLASIVWAVWLALAIWQNERQTRVLAIA